MSRVFISYRRSDTRWAAGRIYDRLAEALGRDNVFFDVSSIDPGDDFVARIEEMVGRCDVLLAIVGPNWISTLDNSGRRRLDGANDLVRVEIRAALDRKIRVIPILVDSAPMPQPDELPSDLAPLARRNAHELSFARFQDDLESFVRVLGRILAGPAPGSSPAPSPIAEPHPDRTPPASPAAHPVATELPFTIALETLGGVATPVFSKGTALPAEASTVFSTAADNQTAVEVTLSAGERPFSKENARIGAFQLTGIHPAKKGVPQIEVKAQVDTSLILTVTAEDLATHRREILDAVDLTRVEVSPAAPVHDVDPAPAARPGGDSKDPANGIPFTIALETIGGVALPLIRKGAALPAEVTELFSTADDSQSSIEVKLSAGEGSRTSENAPVGVFQFKGFPPAPKGIPQIDITVKVDSALVLTVAAQDRATRQKEVLGAVDLRHLKTPRGAPIRDEPRPEPPRAGDSSSGGESDVSRPASGSLKTIFGNLFGKNRPEAGAPGPDLRYDLTLTFDESFSGTETNVTVNGRHLKVKIPPGVESGNRIRLKGEAEPGRPAGAGDIYLFVTVLPHPQFERRDKDIYFKVSLQPGEAAQGLMVKVPRLGDRAPLQVTVPPGLASGSRLRLAGQGFPDVAGASAPGDLYVVVDIQQDVQPDVAETGTGSGAA